MIIDLSVPINNKTPSFPGDTPIDIKSVANVVENGYSQHDITITTHIGTHIDAPSHMITGGKNLDEYPISRFAGQGVVINVTGGFDIEAIRQTDIPANAIVLFRTDWSKSYDKPAYFEDYTPVPAEVNKWLVEQKPKIVGFDMCSPDYEPFEIHKELFKNDILIIENLRNLDQIPAEQSFKVFALPLKIKLDGAPARVIAVID